tara:strand:- start:507 stop:704 length:198 start_codon:yes stop_codon:yes gene_type:complete
MHHEGNHQAQASNFTLPPEAYRKLCSSAVSRETTAVPTPDDLAALLDQHPELIFEGEYTEDSAVR